jgi:hypothetical protein
MSIVGPGLIGSRGAGPETIASDHAVIDLVRRCGWRAFALILFATVNVGCGNNQSTTAPSTTTTTAPTLPGWQIFSGTLTAQGSQVYSFDISQAGTASAMLASLMPSSGGPAVVSVVVGLGIGTPSADGTTCMLNNSVNTAPALTPQIQSSVVVGKGCVEIYDIGNLTAPVNFAVRIVPAVSTTTTSPTTETRSYSIASSHAVSPAILFQFISGAGVTTVTLTTTTPATAVGFGVGQGIPDSTGKGCSLGSTVNTVAGAAQLTTPVDLGEYCVEIYDVGNLTGTVTFTISIVHP